MKCETIKIPADMRAELDALAKPSFQWTPEMDAVLREYGEKVSRPKLAKVMAKKWSGVTESRVRKRMKALGIKGRGSNAKEM